MSDFQKKIIFCLPFAGGGCYSYQEFQRYADDAVEIAAVDLPGRGRRFSEPLLTNLHDMADDVYGQIRQRHPVNYAVYGHSMGACIAHLVVKRILRDGFPAPHHLFVSGRECPSVPGKEKNWHRLSRPAFLEVLERFEGTDREVMENRELMELFEPVLRADFQALAEFKYERSAPVNIPITVIHGAQDNVTRADALKWQDETTASFSLLEFDGGHFFIFHHAARIVDILQRGIPPLIPSTTSSVVL